MEELNVERIIEIHDDIIKEYGGTGGLLIQGTLELLIYKVNREKDVFKRAALILHTIAAQHPFFDGNKRTAFVTAENVLGEAGYFLDAGDDEIVELMRKIAEYKHTVKIIENWIREKAMATSAPIF
ncbi:MAG: type II toxin-antitoxin system death-on-curing family toxin [Candidatus Methanoperedens sp.]|nr:type II toxin-antitoxin system death-on-curing family toxin [Candidatus Methanoperedens sp.]MCE8428517.1 type II toxin-antitoxin system death-on-curing family toxin [Candidatus Methanoperedens sp.]